MKSNFYSLLRFNRSSLITSNEPRNPPKNEAPFVAGFSLGQKSNSNRASFKVVAGQSPSVILRRPIIIHGSDFDHWFRFSRFSTEKKRERGRNWSTESRIRLCRCMTYRAKLSSSFSPILFPSHLELEIDGLITVLHSVNIVTSLRAPTGSTCLSLDER